MNKLAPIALFLLLFFGGSLWYLANSELNANVQARIIKVSNYYTEQLLSIEKVEVNIAEGTGIIYGIKLQNSTLYQNKYMLEIPQLSFVFDTKSLTGKIINIDEIILSDGQFFIENIVDQSGHRQNNFSQLYQRLNDKIALIQDRRKQKSEPYIQANAIKLANSQQVYLPLTNDLQQNQQQRYSYTLNAIGKGEGLPASLFGIEVLRKTLETIINAHIPTSAK
ncbi:MAG: hypothetical protein MJK12_02890 [Colwellia sp.]|nr:hypothetical protein [Colwellia sp.]